jgi:hypothetical protein
MVDTGGAVSIASRHLLSNIKPAKKRGNPSCQMVTVNGLTPPYSHQGELHFTDEAGLPILLHLYQLDPPGGPFGSEPPGDPPGDEGVHNFHNRD